MKIDRVLELLKIERECVTRQSPCNEKSKLCDRNCGECDIAQNDLELIEMYDFVISMIETLIGRSQWISVKDRLSETRHAVLVYTPHHKNIWAASMHEDGNWYIWSPGGRVLLDPDWHGPITHWMPLPTPPEVNRDED